MTARADLVLTGGAVLTVDEPGSVVPDGAADVRHTLVDGRMLLRNGVPRTIDEAGVLDRMTELRRTRSADPKERL